MSELLGYQYVVLRCVPSAVREEFLNVGVVLYCQQAAFLDVAWEVTSSDCRRFRRSLIQLRSSRRSRLQRRHAGSGPLRGTRSWAASAPGSGGSLRLARR